MRATIRRYAPIILLIIIALSLSVTSVLAQEEADVIEATGNPVGMIFVVGLGALVILGLGAAMGAQAKDET